MDYQKKYFNLKNSIKIGGKDRYNCKSVGQLLQIKNITIHDFCYKDSKRKYDSITTCAWSNKYL